MTPMVEAFGRLAARLEPEGSWIQEHYAQTAPGGRSVSPFNPDARCWCLEGALFSLRLPMAVEERVFEILEAAAGNLVVTWNDADNRTHQQVRDLVAAALAAYVADVGND